MKTEQQERWIVLLLNKESFFLLIIFGLFYTEFASLPTSARECPNAYISAEDLTYLNGKYVIFLE